MENQSSRTDWLRIGLCPKDLVAILFLVLAAFSSAYVRQYNN
jgi:hypothetical protein